jgi:hypothetical protein
MAKEVVIINKTPHKVTLVTESGNIDFLPDAEPARVSVTDREVDSLQLGEVSGSIVSGSIVKASYGDVTGLPEPNDSPDIKIFYLVSRFVQAALPERSDLLVPTKLVRDELGNVVGCKAFEVL